MNARIHPSVLAIIVATCAAYSAALLAQTANGTAPAKPPAAGVANAAAQAKPAAAAPAKAGAYKIPRTPEGQPDLQGFWTNATLIRLERPNGVTKEYVTKEEF
jgi:hypothetical protein